MITTVLFLMSILLNNAEANATAPPGSKIILKYWKAYFIAFNASKSLTKSEPLKFSLLIENVSSPGLLANNESQIDFFETSTSVILLSLNDK